MSQVHANVGSVSVATFAGGCFWCLEADMEKLPGVVDAISGYSGGDEQDPKYEDVARGETGHLESVQVRFDTSVLSYEALLEYFWRHVNPTDSGGQFVDRGAQYRSAIFYHDSDQKRLAETSKKRLDESGVLDSAVVTEILPLDVFWEAEGYHQDYYKENPIRYKFYRRGSGRDQFLKETYGKEKKMSKKDLKATLSPIQYKVTQEDGTEPAFDNAYWDNKREGIYVDVVSGEVLFSSKDKFDSGTGWPSFTRPLKVENIVEKVDRKLFLTRTEVRSEKGDSHLGHVFSDGPRDKGGMRYCINSAALRFVAKADLESEGYGEWASLFN